MSLREERAAWLALLFGGQVRRQTAKSALLRWCVQGNCAALDLLSLPADEARAALELDAQQAAALSTVAQERDPWGALLDRLTASGIEIVLRMDPAYPDALIQRLSEAQAPYALFARGPLDLLAEPALALQGSAEPAPGAQQAAQQTARMLGPEGQVLVGGGESGIDRLALEAAHQAGGATVRVLAEGLEAAHVAATERSLVLSPYLPEQARTPACAQARMPLVLALCEALLLFDPGTGPREWPGYTAAHAHGLPTLLWSSTCATTDAWLAAGAVPFGDAAAACRTLSEATGLGAVHSAEPGHTLREPGADDTLYQSPTYADADAAIDALRRAGAVPPALARRMRAATWQGEEQRPREPERKPGGTPS